MSRSIARGVAIAALIALGLEAARRGRHRWRRAPADPGAERLRAVGALAAGMAHDLNNLLTPILAGLDLVTETDDDERRDDAVRAIRTAALRAAELVDQVRLFSLEHDVVLEEVDLRSLVAEAVEVIRPRCPDDVVIECSYEDIPIVVEAVPVQLHQIVVNLLTNALQAMEHGGGRLTVQLAVGRRRHAELVIADTGVGIDEATQRHLFEPFFTTRTDKGGTGLGLFAVARLVDRLGGRIRIESEPGAGCTARVTIPLLTVERAPLTGRILLVDDNATVLRVLESILRELGHDVTACPTATAALERFEADAEYDLVLSDYGMPDLPGDELARRIRARSPRIPIVLLTGHHDDDLVDDRWTVLTKPVGLAILDRAIGDALRAARPPVSRRPTVPT